MPKRTTGEGPNPSGLCECGCGGLTPIARVSDARRETVAGTPKRFINGHQGRKSPVEYLVDSDTGCWIWQRAQMNTGYGSITVDGTTQRAHRVYYERAHGPIPVGMQLDHLCRRRNCVNPAHLEPVTSAENSRRGDNTKLTSAEVEAIRAEYAAGGTTRRVLAAEYGVLVSTIGKIVRGTTWSS